MEIKRLKAKKKSNNTTFLKYAIFYSVFIFLMLFIGLLPANYAYAFEVKGLQPLPPYGIFSTFSAESLKQNKVGFAFAIEKSGKPDLFRTTFNFAYGIHDKLEFNLTIPYVVEWKGEDEGFEDFSVGIKHRIFDETKYRPALAYILAISSASGRDEFTTDGDLSGGLLITKKVGPFKGHLNLFYSKPGKSELKEQYTVNIGAELAVAHNSKVLAEIVGKKNYFKSKIDLFEWRLGYRIATTDYLYTTVGAGFDIKDRTPDYRLLFSISAILPHEKKKIQKIYEE